MKGLQFALAVGIWLAVSSLAWATPGVIRMEEQPYHTGAFRLQEMDLWVQAKGVPVRQTRVYTPEAGWIWNARWQDLTFQSKGAESEIDETGPHYDKWAAISRQDATFPRVTGQPRFGYRGTYLEATTDGFTWHNRQGDWIDYDTNGHVQRYGDAENNYYVLGRDAHGRIATVSDKQDRTLMTLGYVGDSARVATVTDYSGREVTYHYTGERLTGVTDVLGYDWTYEYDDKGRLYRRIDPKLQATTYNYSEDRVVEIVHPDGASTVYNYGYVEENGSEYYDFTVKGEDGSVTEQKTWNGDPQGLYLQAQIGAAAGSQPLPATEEKKVSSMSIDGELYNTVYYNWKELIRREVDESGRTTITHEDRWGNPLKTEYADGAITTRQFSSQYDYLTQLTNPAGTTFQFAYDDAGRLIDSDQAIGTAVERHIDYTHTEDSTTVRVSGPGGQSIERASYFDDRGNRIRWVDGEGYETTYTYDVMGNVLTMTTPRDTLYTYTYDAAGNLLTETDPLGRVTRYSYDKVGNRISEVAPNDSKTTYGHDARDQWTQVEDALGQQAQRHYDASRRELTGTSAGTEKIRERYNALGQPLETVDGAGNRIAYTYDKLVLQKATFPTFTQSYEYNNQQLVSAITTQFDGTSSTQRFEYDILGQLVRKISADNRSVEYRYDELGRVTQLIDAAGGITRFTWDYANNLVQVQDPENRAVRMEYDNNGFLTAEIYSADGVEQRREYAYDGNGNLKETVSPDGQKRVYTYDDADQLTAVEVYAAPGDTTPAKTVAFTYNDLGLVAGYDDGETAATYTYTELGQLASVTTDYGPFTKTFSYGYNADGVLTSYTTPEGVTYQYGYNAAGQPASVTIPDVGAIGIGDYQWTQPQTITLPGGSRIERRYNGVMHMTSNTLQDPAQTALMEVAYGYDLVGNITSQQTDHGDYQYTYDTLNRLTGADYPQRRDETFDYDASGNRTGHTEGTDGTTTLIYNDGNQLTRQGDTYYQYDANGNLRSQGSDPTGQSPDRVYVYNADERLVRVEDGAGGVIAKYGYNPLGHRIWKDVGGVRTYFLYTMNGLSAEYRADGSLIREYQYLPGSSWMTDPLFMRQGGNTYYYQTDHLGRPLTLIQGNGAVVWKARYDAFGQAYPEVETVTNNLRLSGQYYDAETGLHHNYMRDYDPALGRYIQADPLGLGGGLNRYAYARLSPLMAIDPYGLQGRRFSDMVFDLIAPKDEHGNPIPLPQGFVDGVVGTVDGVTGIIPDWVPGIGGGTRGVRERLGINGGVDYCSGIYRFTHGVGEIFTPGIGVGGLLLKGLPKLGWLLKAKRSARAEQRALKEQAAAKRASSPCKCFVAGTLVQTAEGAKPIEEVKVGDQVWAKQDVTGDVALKPVVALVENPPNTVLRLTLADDDDTETVVRVTPNHPFWLAGRSWTRVENLKPGDQVETRGGGSLRVVSLEQEEKASPTYNFSVADYHSYFVGEAAVWVHNTCPDNDSANPKELIGRQTPAEMSESRVNSYRKKYRKAGEYNQEPIDVADVGGGKKIILDGHHRAQAAAREKINEVPIRIHKASEAEAEQLLREAAEAMLYE
ncbi:polymorphic toxin-type HINT domain-containing protein [Marinobacter halodurans]|nr:polymorphic toxin-type HINT domain-containing protein [Marinobacter halodurans]